jgi:hypothetical protein
MRDLYVSSLAQEVGGEVVDPRHVCESVQNPLELTVNRRVQMSV